MIAGRFRLIKTINAILLVQVAFVHVICIGLNYVSAISNPQKLPQLSTRLPSRYWCRISAEARCVQKSLFPIDSL